MKGLVKVLEDQLEEKAKVKIDSKDVIIQCMVRWAAMMYNR